MTSSISGSTPIASAGPESVTRLIHRIWVASSGTTSVAVPMAPVSPMKPAKTTPKNDGEDLAHVRRQQVAQELLDVVEDHPALPDRGDDGGEVVVGEDHLGRFLGDLACR